MAPCEYSNRQGVRRDILISSGSQTHLCGAQIDPHCLATGGSPTEIAGFLDLPKPEWESLANSERLILTLSEAGEPYRMILDPSTGRFIARRL